MIDRCRLRRTGQQRLLIDEQTMEHRLACRLIFKELTVQCRVFLTHALQCEKALLNKIQICRRRHDHLCGSRSNDLGLNCESLGSVDLI